MRQSQMLVPTLRDVPADADIKSHQLLLRAGYIKQTASGIYSFLPLGLKVLRKVEQIVREEMENAGAHELLMPALQPSELWKETGRWHNFGPELMRLHDRHQREFALGATHEEVITALLRDEIKSYKKLPLTLFQIQTKFRDEQRPRFGLLRGREFVMKDAYSFHTNQASLDEVYEKMVTAYSNIFSRCGLNFRAVLADSGSMGGKDTHEFMVLSEIGEDTIAYSDQSSFAANIEMAPVLAPTATKTEAAKALTKVATPNVKTIDEVAEALQVTAADCLKSLLFSVDDDWVLVLVRGDHEVNDIKLKHLLDAKHVVLATPEETLQRLGCPVGSIGPISLPAEIKVVADAAVASVVNGVCGANEAGLHYIHVTPERDFTIEQYADIRFIKEGDPSPDGKGTIKFAKGIEVGHVFKLGTFYSEAMGATYLDENGRSNPMIMGCYGIGVSRTMAAIVEQYHDDNGIVWPVSISPFHVHLIPVNISHDEQRNLSDHIYELLRHENIPVLFDDRKERPGVKFADSDLFGFPLRITVGKRASEGIVELKSRSDGDLIEIKVENLSSEIKKRLAYTE